MKRLVFECKVKGSNLEQYEVRIIEQTHRCLEFGTHNDTFVAKNGIKFQSVGCPQWKPRNNLLYVRGYERNKDDQSFIVSILDYKKLLNAMKEYNETFKIPMSHVLDDNLFEVQ